MMRLLAKLGREAAHCDELDGNLSQIESDMRTIGERIYLLRAHYACISARFAHVSARLAELEELVHDPGAPLPSRGPGS